MKNMLFLFVIFIMLAGTACSKNVSDTSRDLNTFADGNLHMSADLYADDDVVVFLTHYQEDGCRRFMYYDNASGICSILCGKPECTHDSEECNAIVGSSSTSAFGMGILHDKIYWIADNHSESGYKGKYLYQMNLDGTGRNEVRQIVSPDQRDQMITSNMFVGYTDEYMIIAGGRHGISSGTEHLYLTLRAYSLVNSQKDLILYDEEVSGALYFCISGDRIYYSVTTQEPTADSEEWNQNSKLQLYCCDLKSGRTENLFDADVPFYPWEFSPYGNQLYFSTLSDLHSPNAAYVLDISARSIDRSIPMEEEPSGFGTGSVIDKGKIISYTFPDGDPSEYELTVKDFEGRVLFSSTGNNTMITADNRGRTRVFAGSDSDNLYFFFSEVIDNVNREWLMAYPLSGAEPKLIYTDNIAADKLEDDGADHTAAAEESDTELKARIELTKGQTEDGYYFEDLSETEGTRIEFYLTNDSDAEIFDITCSVAINGSVITKGYNDKWPAQRSGISMSQPLYLGEEDFADGKATIRYEVSYPDPMMPDKLIVISDEITIILGKDE